jgi:hypothetical protein
MRPRAVIGLAVAAGFVGFVAHTAAATQCPMRELGACTKVHMLLARTRAPEPAPPVMLALAQPMRGHGLGEDRTGVGLRMAAVETRP